MLYWGYGLAPLKPKGGIYCNYFQNRLMLSKLKSGKSNWTLCRISCQNWILLPFPIPVIDMICELGPSSISVLPQRISTLLSFLPFNAWFKWRILWMPNPPPASLACIPFQLARWNLNSSLKPPQKSVANYPTSVLLTSGIKGHENEWGLANLLHIRITLPPFNKYCRFYLASLLSNLSMSEG